jgi:hypothetical protein
LHNTLNILSARDKNATAAFRRGPYSVIFPACGALPAHCRKERASPVPFTEPEANCHCEHLTEGKKKTLFTLVASNAIELAHPQHNPSLQGSEQQEFSSTLTLDIETLLIASKASTEAPRLSRGMRLANSRRAAS